MTHPATADQLLAGFRSTRRDFEALVRAMDDARMTAPVAPGGWSPREILIHIAAWLMEATERIPALMAGAPSRQYDEDAFNGAAVAAAADWTAAQAYGAYKRAADRFETLAAELSDDILLEEPDVRAWLESAARVMITEHLDELRAVADFA